MHTSSSKHSVFVIYFSINKPCQQFANETRETKYNEKSVKICENNLLETDVSSHVVILWFDKVSSAKEYINSCDWINCNREPAIEVELNVLHFVKIS